MKNICKDDFSKCCCALCIKFHTCCFFFHFFPQDKPILNKQQMWSQNNTTVGSALALYIADLDMIPSILHDSLSSTRSNP